MTTFILGGTGFIGRRVVARLAAAGEPVVCFGPRADLSRPAGVRTVRGDAANFDELMAAIAGARPERLLNLAYLHGNANDPRTAFRVNLLAMDNVFEAARLAGVGRVVFASTLGVHGLQASHGEAPITEDAPFAPVGSYCRQKVGSEWQAEDHADKHGMSIVAVRPANVSGFDKQRGSVEHVRLVTEPACGRPVRLPHRDFMRLVVDVDDVAEIFVRILLARALRHRAYHTGGHATSLGDLAGLVSREVPGASIAFDAETGGRALSNVYLVDNRRVVEEFGICLTPLAETVAKVAVGARRAGQGA